MRFFSVVQSIAIWLAFIVLGIVLFAGAAVIWLLTLPFDPNRRVLQQYSCLWAAIYVGVNPFWSVSISGLEHVDRKKPYVMVSNHQSMADILVVFRSFLHFKWVSKKSMFKVPLLGWNMWLNGYIPIERGDAASREACMAHCRRWLAQGSSVFFFPEGTRSADGTMRSFKLGAFQLALETGTEILPMVIRGSRYAIPKHSIVLSRKARMSLEVLPPIKVDRNPALSLEEQAHALAEQTYEMIHHRFCKI